MTENIRQRCLIGCAGPIHTVPLTVFLLLESFLLKRTQLVQAGSFLSEWDTFRAWKPDLFFFAVLGLVFSIVISATGGRLRAALSALLHALAAFSGIFLIVNHYYYSSQGTSLSWGVARYALRNLRDNNGLLTSEAHAGRLAVIGLQLTAVAASVLLVSLRRVRGWIKANSCSRKRQAGAFYLVAAIALEGYSFVPPLRDVNPALTQNPVRELAVEMFSRESDKEAGPAIPESERMDAPLELVKDPSVPNLNVVLIIFESISWKNTDIFTPGLGTTPFLAQLAKKGAVVERMYTVVPHTTKALISLLGGIYPYLEQEVKEAKPGILPQRGLAHILRRQGYRTAFFQTANNYENRAQVVDNLGYEEYRGLADMPQDGFAPVNYHGKEERLMLKPSLEWVDSARDVPFCLTYLTLCTHHDYRTPPSFQIKNYGVPNPIYNQYLNAVRSTDEFVGKVYQGIKKKGLLDKTLFIVIGDHGEAFGEHGLIGHNYVLFEEGLRTAAVLYSPSIISPGTTISGDRSILDLVPSICDALGLQAKRGAFIGESFFKPVAEDRKLYFSGWSKSQVLGLRRGPLKAIFWPIGNKMDLFDNRTDLLDEKDLTKGQHPNSPDLEALRSEMTHWSRGVDAQYRVWEKGADQQKKTTVIPRLKNALRATCGGLISLLGYEMYPSERVPGSSLWVRMAFQYLERINRPIEFVAHLIHENGESRMSVLIDAESFDFKSLEPGEYFARDKYLTIPVDWLPGEVEVRVGFRDKRNQRMLPITETDKTSFVDGEMVRLGRVRVMESVLPSGNR